MEKTNKAKKPSWFKELKAEFNRIIWPTKERIAKETVVVLDANFPVRMLFDGRNDAENRQVGCHIDQDVVNQRSHAQGRTADHAQHDVARLRDG